MLDDELRSLVSVDPPPGFEARIRAAVAAQESPSALSRVLRWWMVPVAATIVLVIASWPETPPSTPATELLHARATTAPAAFPPTVGHQPPDRQTSPPTHLPSPRIMADPSLPAVQFDPVESRALQALFSSTPAIAIVTIVPPDDAPIVIPEISIAPLVADDSPQGDWQ